MLASDAGFSVADLLASAQSEIGHALDLAGLAEQFVTPELARLAEEGGGRMAGTEWALKGESSLTRKVEAMVTRGEATNVEDALSKVHDMLRYTMTFDPADYAASVEKTLAAMRDQGFNFKLSDVENSWRDRPEYHGINSNMKTPGGQWMELQFHTPASYVAKDRDLHPLYEEYRLSATTAERRAELKQEMIGITSKLETPDNVNGIGVHVGGRQV